MCLDTHSIVTCTDTFCMLSHQNLFTELIIYVVFVKRSMNSSFTTSSTNKHPYNSQAKPCVFRNQNHVVTLTLIDVMIVYLKVLELPPHEFVCWSHIVGRKVFPVGREVVMGAWERE